ncbi:bifunctional 2',3'-cyclic-nucleotide 2'-phosphodiesterase/3'-nucleotidase [Aliiroseovarius crassostreae]|uniref:bifunctional 2',3'-cyclic-nucleotide 2'-phosphodiesterase/3'-nucleotidase n=1 Tax=Aliiroseovarius crassostreae TaxID=154981 RepID=UPI003C7A46D8
MTDALADEEMEAKPRQMRVRLLATTDLHMHILPYDYFTDLPNARWGLSQTAKLIQQARTEEGNTLLFDAGDFLHGTAMGDFVVEQAQQGKADEQVHPMIAAMNHLRYDAATLGNHDFDRGVDVLLSAVEQAEFPIVSSNIVLNKGDTPSHDSTFMPPFTILNRYFIDDKGEENLVRIGVIGFLPPNSIHAGTKAAPTPGTRDILRAARDFVPQLRAKGVDVVVALAHSGIGVADHREGMENAIIPLSKVDGIDVIIGGHSHQYYPPQPGASGTQHAWLAHPEVDADAGCINGKPVVIAGFWGSHLGVIDLNFLETPEGWQVETGPVELREVPESQPDTALPELSDLLGPLHESTLMHVRTRIGYVHQDLYSYFALAGMDLSTRLVQQAMVDFTRQLVGYGAAPDLPVLASSAAFKCGGLGGPGYYTAIDAGELTLRSVADLYIFPNEISLVRANGAYLKHWLERAVSVFNQVMPGRRMQMLKDAGTPGYLLESVLGLGYQVDLSQPARYSPAGRLQNPGASRIRGLNFNGRPVTDKDEFLLATSDFRVRGGGGFPTIAADRIVPVTPMSIRDLVRHHIEQHEHIDLTPELQWRFAPVDGASVVFASSPAARQYSETIDGLNVRDMNEEDLRGFAMFELML